jgi:hypothetical protein
LRHILDLLLDSPGRVPQLPSGAKTGRRPAAAGPLQFL